MKNLFEHLEAVSVNREKTTGFDKLTRYFGEVEGGVREI